MVHKRSTERQYVWGAILIALGVVFLLQDFFSIEVFSFIWRFWPILLIVWGVTVLRDSRS
jgi:hypothetical protein